jgi:xylulokinase
MARLIGLDVGTSGTKAILIDETGAVLKSAASAHTLEVTQPGWAEQDPRQWRHAAFDCLEQIGLNDVDAIGLTGQMHGSVFLDKNGEVVRPALLWCDQRTVQECSEIESAVGAERLRNITGNPALTGFQLPKTLWLRNNELSRFQQVERVLLPKDYIRKELTGVEAADVSDASGVGCLNVRERNWSTEVLLDLELDPRLLPPVVESAEQTGAHQGIPVAGGGGDQAAAAIGTGAVTPGLVSISLGTSGVVFEANDGPPAYKTDAVHEFCHTNGRWHRMGVMLSCGGAVRWARDTFFGEDAGWDDFNCEAERAPAGSEGVLFLPHLTGERCPYVDPSARGVFEGLSLASGRGHLARAVIEGVCFGLAECLELMNPGQKPDVVRVNGGGASSALWLQILSDVMGCPVETLETDEGPAFGAAILGGVAGGVWSSVSEGVEAAVRVKKTINPSGQDYSLALERHRSLYPVLARWRGANS